MKNSIKENNDILTIITVLSTYHKKELGLRCKTVKLINSDIDIE